MKEKTKKEKKAGIGTLPDGSFALKNPQLSSLSEEKLVRGNENKGTTGGIFFYTKLIGSYRKKVSNQGCMI